MPLLVDVVSKISIKKSLLINPDREVLYKNLTNGRQILSQTNAMPLKKYHANIELNNMTTEQKRKYLLLKYIRQYT